MSGTIHVTTRDGDTHDIPAPDDLSVMEILRDAGIGEIAAMCGGCCSCATCHVYVAEEDLALFAPASEDENDLLDSADSRRPNSRLSCQLRIAGMNRDISITVAPED